MDDSSPQFDNIVALAECLSLQDKIRLIAQVAASLQRDIPAQKPRRSLYGLWADDVNISAADIDEARREMWGNFPREDVV